METSPTPGRDPVCEAIERLLRDLEKCGDGPLEVEEANGFVQLRYGGLAVEAPTLDIALVRLADHMIDSPPHREHICALLRSSLSPAA